MRYRRSFVGASLFLLAAVAAAAPPAQPKPTVTVKPATPPLRVAETMTWTVDGAQRTALVYAPAVGASTDKHPIVFGFHGHGGTMQGSAKMFHYQTLWPEAVVVYPQGLKGASLHDPTGQRTGWQQQAGDSGDRDLHLFDAIVAALHQKYTIDDGRVYTAGFSNGATFSYLLWVTRGTQLAAIAACAGHFADDDHLPSEPRSVVHIGGTADTTAPWSSQQDAIATDRNVDHAMAAGQACGPHCTLYPSTSHTPVETLIHSGGHVYPPWASKPIVAFFKAHAKP
ncbi:MAG TPA: esterase [Thermoanaerobaculia bacterium]|jgi:polyhydroxybutyrate depolymerase|nr:esterase [Thermoanaerobaculia bacterium]